MPNNQDTLSTEVDYVTTSDNTQDEPSELLSWDVPDGAEITLREGDTVIMDAETTSGNSGPSGGNADPEAGTRFALGYAEPNDPLDAPTLITEFSITPFNQLSLADQLSEQNAQRRTIQFIPDRVPGGVITVDDSDTLALWVVSGDTIDGSALFFEYNGAEVRNA